MVKEARRAGEFWIKIKKCLKRHLNFLGPGMIAATNFLDPGNWATDLQAGSQFGNVHLFTIFVAISCAAVLQILACKLGCVSGQDLGQHCRQACDTRTSHRLLCKWGLLYPLWILAEVSVLFADLGELLGSTIALSLLFPQVPPWVCVMLAFTDVVLVIIFMRGEGTCRAMAAFEIGITLLLFVIVIAAVVLLFQVQPNWANAFKGFLPSSQLLERSSLYTSIAIIGATISPHSLFLGSSLATLERLDEEPTDLELNCIPNLHLSVSHHTSETKALGTDSPQEALQVPPFRTISSIRTYLRHANFDVIASFLTLPLIVNAAVVLIASTVLSGEKPGDLVAMHTLLGEKQGKRLADLYAAALLVSAQVAALGGTLAGQKISQGFLGWKPPAVARRLSTRSIVAIPTFVVVLKSGISGLGALLISSQAAISLILPLIAVPLAYFTSSRKAMTVQGNEGRMGCFTNSIILRIIISSLIFSVFLANVYAFACKK